MGTVPTKRKTQQERQIHQALEGFDTPKRESEKWFLKFKIL